MITLEERKRGSVYKSLETDQEFRRRITARHGIVYGLGGMTDAYLDDVAWTCFQMQRRIIEREV